MCCKWTFLRVKNKSIIYSLYVLYVYYQERVNSEKKNTLKNVHPNIQIHFFIEI